MATFHRVIITISSTLLRLLVYTFLRWIPGHPFPPLILTVSLTYATSFILQLFNTPAYEALADGVSLVTSHTPESDGSGESEEQVDALAQEIGKIRHKSTYRADVGTCGTVVAYKKALKVSKSLLTGLPCPSSVPWSIATFSVNIFLLVMTLGFTYEAHLLYPANQLSFARVGFVSDTTAKILVREPDPSNLPLWLSYRYADGPAAGGYVTSEATWKHTGPVEQLNAKTDYTAPFTIERLKPETRYEYLFSNHHSGFFITAPLPGETPTRSTGQGKFKFLHSSCIIPNFPYTPLSHPLSIPGLRSLAKVLRTFKPMFMLFLGDFIYADLPKRHGSDLATYQRQYRHVYASPDYRLTTSTFETNEFMSQKYDIPWIHTWDDHELNDNWEWNSTGVFASAFGAYSAYHLSVNSPKSFQTYFSFTQGPASFFILDTRSFRSRQDKTMLGKLQLESLLSWIRSPLSPGVRWRFIVSSVPFTKNWHVHNYDTWGGYLQERKVLLEAMWKAAYDSTQSHGHRGAEHYGPISFIVLSGDRHEFAATKFVAPPELGWAGSVVHEFSASPLSMFYLPVRTYWQSGPAFEGDVTDSVIKYLPDGNSKVGAVEIEAPTGNAQSLLRYRLYIDGKETWNYLLVSPPVL